MADYLLEDESVIEVGDLRLHLDPRRKDDNYAGTGYLGVSLVDSVAPLQGFPVLTEFLPLWVGPLDSRGLASVTVPSVPPALAGFPFYSQLVDEIAGTGAVRSSSLVLRTLIY